MDGEPWQATIQRAAKNLTQHDRARACMQKKHTNTHNSFFSLQPIASLLDFIVLFLLSAIDAIKSKPRKILVSKYAQVTLCLKVYSLKRIYEQKVKPYTQNYLLIKARWHRIGAKKSKLGFLKPKF